MAEEKEKVSFQSPLDGSVHMVFGEQKESLSVASGDIAQYQLVANPMDCHDVLWMVGVGLNSLP